MMRAPLIALTLLAVVCGVLGAHVTEQTFSYIKSSPTEKVVLFYKPGDELNKKALKIHKTLAKSGVFPEAVEFLKCDCSAPVNAADVAEAQFSEFPVLFVASMEGGIQKYNGPVEEEPFKEFAQTNLLPVASDQVIAFTNEDDLYDLVDRQNKPVFVKFFEQWCTHCKAMKKTYQTASNRFHEHVAFVEVECSRDAETKEFCAKNGVTGYPTLKLITSDEKIPYAGDRSLADIDRFLRQHVLSLGGTRGASAEASPRTASQPSDSGSGSSSGSNQPKKKLSEMLLERMDQLERRVNDLEHELATLKRAPTAAAAAGTCAPPSSAAADTEPIAHDEL